MKFLVSTDNHCGYSEVKKLNYDDAFVTLDEVFEQSKSNDVDFVLLGFVIYFKNYNYFLHLVVICFMITIQVVRLAFVSFVRSESMS